MRNNHRNRSSRRRMHLCMQDDQNGQKMMVLTSAEETRLTCFILLQNIFIWSNQPSLTADVNTIINLPWYPRKIVHFSLVLSPSRVYYDFYGNNVIPWFRRYPLVWADLTTSVEKLKISIFWIFIFWQSTLCHRRAGTIKHFTAVIYSWYKCSF